MQPSISLFCQMKKRTTLLYLIFHVPLPVFIYFLYYYCAVLKWLRAYHYILNIASKITIQCNLFNTLLINPCGIKHVLIFLVQYTTRHQWDGYHLNRPHFKVDHYTCVPLLLKSRKWLDNEIQHDAQVKK